MAIFRHHRPSSISGNAQTDFSYLSPKDIYLDTACQTLRPQAVVNAMTEYYHEYNACGGRVNYDWGRRVDDEIDATRKQILSLFGKNEKDFFCAFTLNTTYGINLILTQLRRGFYRQIITSNIEHNSVFLPTIIASKHLGIPRKVLLRELDGRLNYTRKDLAKSIVVVNSTSNIDGRELVNVRQLAKDVHENGGILILDAAQTLAHNKELLKNVDFDAACFSGHKMYGPSLGIMVVKKSLHAQMELNFIGGGTVENVQLESYTLLRDEPFSHFEPGLQNFAGIIGLNAAIKWQKKYKPEGKSGEMQQRALSKLLFDEVINLPSVTVLNDNPTPIISFYSDKVDAHRLAVYLSAQGIMARSGYFCCHYHLDVEKRYPPLLRLSIGLNNTDKQINEVIKTLRIILGRA